MTIIFHFERADRLAKKWAFMSQPLGLTNVRTVVQYYTQQQQTAVDELPSQDPNKVRTPAKHTLEAQVWSWSPFEMHSRNSLTCGGFKQNQNERTPHDLCTLCILTHARLLFCLVSADFMSRFDVS